MRTSYFAKYRGKDGISIARGTPKWFDGDIAIELAPPIDLVNRMKSGSISEKQYILEYNKRVLRHLSALEVFSRYHDKVLLCYEKSGEFCHRRLVAEWLEQELGIKVKEVE